jgi:hypothetical protein
VLIDVERGFVCASFVNLDISLHNQVHFHTADGGVRIGTTGPCFVSLQILRAISIDGISSRLRQTSYDIDR